MGQDRDGLATFPIAQGRDGPATFPAPRSPLPASRFSPSRVVVACRRNGGHLTFAEPIHRERRGISSPPCPPRLREISAPTRPMRPRSSPLTESRRTRSANKPPPPRPIGSAVPALWEAPRPAARRAMKDARVQQRQPGPPDSHAVIPRAAPVPRVASFAANATNGRTGGIRSCWGDEG